MYQAQGSVSSMQVVSTCLAGAAFGSLTGAKLAQTFGRKGTLLLDVVPLFLGAFLCATANSLEWIIAGRVVIGIGIGLASGLVPLFISEVHIRAPTHANCASQLPACDPVAVLQEVFATSHACSRLTARHLAADRAARGARHAGQPEPADHLHRHPGRAGGQRGAAAHSLAHHVLAGDHPCRAPCLW
jgi:Sugar (and other) transporter